MKKQQNGLGIASMVIGIMSILISCTGFGIIGIVGVIFSIIVLSQKEKAKGMGVAGLVTSLVGTIISAFLIGAMLFQDDLDSKTESRNENYNEKIEDDEEKEEIEEKEEEENIVTFFEIGEIFNENDCIISVDSKDVEQLKLVVENNSENDYELSVSAMAVNGIMANGYDGVARTSIPSHKKGVMCVKFSGEWQKEVKEIEYIDIGIFVQKNDEYLEDFETGILRIKTNRYVSDKEFDKIESCKESNGLVIVQNAIEKNRISYSIINKNEYTVKTTLENCSINEWAFEPGYSAYEAGDLFGMKIDGLDVIVFPNSISTVYVDAEEFLKEHNIEKVEEFGFSLNIIPDGDYSDLEKTEKINFLY